MNHMELQHVKTDKNGTKYFYERRLRAMKKQVMKVEMYGRTLVIKEVPGTDYPFRVYDIIGTKRTYHLDSFESFQEAWKFVEEELWAGC